MVDMLNSQRALLLAVFSVPLGLSNAIIGLISTIYTLCASLLQPLFGLLADRIGPRWVAAGGVLWMAAAFGLAVSVPSYASLVILVLAALGSGAFHPAGTMEATLRGRAHLSGLETTSASLFFVFGQAGFSIGPAIGGAILDRWGPAGLILLLFLVVPVGLNAGAHIESFEAVFRREDHGSAKTSPLSEKRLMSVIPFIMLAGFRSWTQGAMSSFLPKYFHDFGYRASIYGAIAALYMAGTALGGVSGGWLADRIDKRKVAFGALALGAIPLALYPAYARTPWVYLITPLAGALAGAPHSIIVVLAQRMMPGRTGVASGLVLGFTFASGTLGTLLSGLQADYAGFNAMFLTLSGIALVAAVLALWLPRR